MFFMLTRKYTNLHLKIKSDHWQSALILTTLSVHLADAAGISAELLNGDFPRGALALSVVAVGSFDYLWPGGFITAAC
jgi:hypothetical protein